MKLLKLDTTGVDQSIVNVLEEKFLENEELAEYEIEENGFVVFINNANAFNDYLNEGKVIKAWLLENNIISDPKDNKRFSLVDLKEPEEEKVVNVAELDKKLAVVDKNDSKLLDVLAQLKTKV